MPMPIDPLQMSAERTAPLKTTFCGEISDGLARVSISEMLPEHWLGHGITPAAKAAARAFGEAT